MTQSHHIEGADRPGRWVITVDHASNRVPKDVADGDLGLAPADMARHIAWDPGAAGVARALGAHLDSPVVLSDFSRLVIDPNRDHDDPTLVMQLYDGTVIPGNRGVTKGEVERRLAKYWRPFHAAIADMAASRDRPVLLAIHSFTRQFKGRDARPWQIGILYAQDTRLSDPLMALLRAEPDLCVGDNQPYTGFLKGDSMDRHGLRTGRPHVLIELRNDLIETPAQHAQWAARLAPILDAALSQAQV